MSQEPISGDVSAWNQFQAYTYTLFRIADEITTATLNENWTLKYELLRILYTKLHPLMDKKEQEHHEMIVVNCEEAYKQIKAAKFKKQKRIEEKHIDWLNFWEMELTDVWHKRVPFVPSRSNPEFAMMAGSY